MDMNVSVMFVSLLNLIIILILLGISIYGFILFVKLAHRGIRALDIYIEEKETNRSKQKKGDL